MNFPDKINAVLLAGGTIKSMESEMAQYKGKGHLPINGIPMAARVLKALRDNSHIGQITLVSPYELSELGPEWAGVTQVVSPGEKLIDSTCAGLDTFSATNDPILTVAGDLPLLSSQAVEDFLQGCAEYPDYSIWYGYLNKKTHMAQFPEVRHTWAPMAEGIMCGTGLIAIRAQTGCHIREAMGLFTKARKHPLLLAKIMGFKALWYLLLRRLPIKLAEECGQRIVNTPVKGIECHRAEAAYNVDCREDLEYTENLLRTMESND